ncbi:MULTISPECIES: OmpA family protein [Bradyrhizobium]|jgi:outer membrane protein OmpA-like peptidoglycan-associated protein|uniref:OmpA family protein n=1 Tax=Bradyrhizobium TaxID=374 RepID=UPI000399AE6F|nr:OmpA family protein [Bradyrhizobium denitrificans]MCL8484120.1 OmpA family protein [Bradyrhizobium denitrificans]RTL99510.1 MAG: OmpA family protein [Bradyrhizobiaceae bacterium]
MLAPSPNFGSSPLPHGMPSSSAAARFEPCTVAGEEAPVWLAAAFAVAGVLIAIMSAALWQQSLARAPEVAASAPPAVTQAPMPAPAERTPEPMLKPPETPSPEPLQTPVTIAAPAAAPEPVISVPSPTPVAALPEPATAARKAATECFAPLSIAFERGSTRPNPADVKRSLPILQSALARHGDAAVLVEGHTDASGSEDLNVLLSYSRAKAVAELLKRDGIAAHRITVRAAGAGEARGTAEAVAGDRKAVLRLAGVDDCDQLTAAKRP